MFAFLSLIAAHHTYRSYFSSLHYSANWFFGALFHELAAPYHTTRYSQAYVLELLVQ